MPEIRIKIDPGSPGIAQLEKLVERATDREGLLKNLGEALLATTQDRFQSQSDPSGAAWAALAPSTVARRGSARPILRVSGRLYGSLTYQVAGDTLQLGPNTVYAAVHQFGHTFEPRGKSGKGVTVPARPYVGYGPADEKAAIETAEDWFSLDR